MFENKIETYKKCFNIIDKIVEISDDKKNIHYKLLGMIEILSKEISYIANKTYLCGICIRTKKIANDIEKNSTDLKDLFNNKKKCNQEFWIKLLECKSLAQKTVIWFDHVLGGGTEVYTLNRIKNLNDETFFLRIQNNGTDAYLVTYFFKKLHKSILVNRNELETIIEGLLPDEIVINNLASYKNPISILTLVEKYKTLKICNVIYMGHDFQCICPAVTMVNSKNVYCNTYGQNACEECIKKFVKPPIKPSFVFDYQKKYAFFINNIVDEIIVFSKSTRDIYLTFFPNIVSKIDIIPHEVTQMEKVNIKEHKNINIAVLGNITLPKGAEILEKIDRILPKFKNVQMLIFGKYTRTKLKHIKIKGSYEIANLPNLMEKNNIDIIFIPSICPETFSYVASEAIEMGLPIACFNIGAPAEKITTSRQGVVISEINELNALKEICTYINDTQRKDA